MALCKDCQFYKPIDDSKGDCFGHEIPATLNADYCPTKSFKPRVATGVKVAKKGKAKK